MSVYQIKLPPCTYGGEGSIRQIKEILKREQARNVLVFTDRVIRETGLLDSLCHELQAAGVGYTVFDELKAEPSYQEVEQVLQATEDISGDLIIAIGGGSVMDVAKLVSVLKGAPYCIKDLLAEAGIAKKQLKSVMIPTTCGTGAEATCNAIVAVPEEQTKKGIVNEEMIPDYVILDAETLRGLPPQIVAATGVDALAHAVECYTSGKATPFSDTYALAGAKLIFQNLIPAYQDPNDMQAKSNMLLGAYYGGIAITASGTTAVHALAYPLGGKYHIAHGVSNAMLLAPVMRFNMPECEIQLAQLCDAVWPALARQTTCEKAGHVIVQLEHVVKETNIPTNLQAFGVGMEDLEFLVQAGSQQTRLLNNNRRKLSLEDIRLLYQKVLN